MGRSAPALFSTIREWQTQMLSQKSAVWKPSTVSSVSAATLTHCQQCIAYPCSHVCTTNQRSSHSIDIPFVGRHVGFEPSTLSHQQARVTCRTYPCRLAAEPQQLLSAQATEGSSLVVYLHRLQTHCDHGQGRLHDEHVRGAHSGSIPC